MILASGDDMYDKMDDLYDVIYDKAGDKVYKKIYDGILEDMYDDFYDGILDDAYDNAKYSSGQICVQMNINGGHIPALIFMMTGPIFALKYMIFGMIQKATYGIVILQKQQKI